MGGVLPVHVRGPVVGGMLPVQEPVGGRRCDSSGLACTMLVQGSPPALPRTVSNSRLLYLPACPLKPSPSESQDDIELEPRFNLGTESLSAGVTWKVGLSKGGRYLPYSA